MNELRRVAMVAVALAPMACGGVSVRYVVESDMRFEHCYRIDEDPGVAVGDKRACWEEWRDRYMRGQDANRIAYANERLRILQGATPTVATPAMAMSSATGCPLPNSPYAPPPSVVTTGVKIGVAAAPPDRVCSDGCNRDWKTCGPACNGNIDCLGSCDGKLRTCMKACF